MDSFVLDAVCVHGHMYVIPAAACPLVLGTPTGLLLGSPLRLL